MVAFYKIKRKRANVKFKTGYFSTKLCVKFSYQLFDIFLFNYFIFVRMLVLFCVLCLFLCMCERESEREREDCYKCCQKSFLQCLKREWESLLLR